MRRLGGAFLDRCAAKGKVLTSPEFLGSYQADLPTKTQML